MIYPYTGKEQRNWATIEHLNLNGPFYWTDGKSELQEKDIVICCGSCNSSRGRKRLCDWFTTSYCIDQDINQKTVSEPVKAYLETRASRLR